MAIHSWNPNRARQLAAIHAKERTAGEFHHVTIVPIENGFTVNRHHAVNTHMQASQFRRSPFSAALGGPTEESAPETMLQGSHHVASLDDLHDHLDDILGHNVVHRPVGQHLAVHIPQIRTQNSEPWEP